MANIILLWNTHPNESPVTLPMARKLKGYEKTGKGRKNEKKTTKEKVKIL